MYGVNPYLPSFEYIPDGEPRVFGDRVYLYGSHDRFHGAHFCLNDYVCWSAPVSSPGQWRYEGVIFRKDQDPRNQNIPEGTPENQPGRGIEDRVIGDLNGPGIHAMWAPDVTRGADGKYYLYYCLDWLPEIGVAVCSEPAGKYEFLGFVHHADGQVLGRAPGDKMQFDPGVYVDDDGSVYLYSGNAARDRNQPNPNAMSQVMRLKPDMITLMEEPRKLLPDLSDAEGHGFEGHEFFEASSIRKIGDRYILVYSSVQSHELCWAWSAYPDRDFRFGGTLVDIGDVFLNGRTAEKAVAPLGNTHGGLAWINGAWYVFYHRQTNQTQYSRQACAERIEMDENGRFLQAEVTSCGLNDGPLKAEGRWPARIACILRRNGRALFSHPQSTHGEEPYMTQDLPDAAPSEALLVLDDVEPVQYIANFTDGCEAGYRYFRLSGSGKMLLEVRGCAEGEMEIATEEGTCGRTAVSVNTGTWSSITVPVGMDENVHTLLIRFRGSGKLDFRSFTFA